MIEQNPHSKSRLLAKVTWELLKTESFETLADLTDALKCRCVRLRIPYTADDINGAYQLIASNTPLVRDPFAGLQRVRHLSDLAPDPRAIAKQDAHDILARLGVVAMVKAIPDGDQAAHEGRLREQIASQQREAYQAERQRRPLRDRLDDIFAGKP